MKPVRSSAIRAAGYDPVTHRMKILFAQGHAYDFCDVPEQVYRQLMNARSKGTFYNEYIRDRYPCS